MSWITNFPILKMGALYRWSIYISVWFMSSSKLGEACVKLKTVFDQVSQWNILAKWTKGPKSQATEHLKYLAYCWGHDLSNKMSYK